MDPGARACPNLRMDRDVYLGYWLLFNPEVAPHESIWVVSRGGSMGVVDLGSDTALARRSLLPLSALLEVAAFMIFIRTVSGHRPQDSGKTKLEEWVYVVIA